MIPRVDPRKLRDTLDGDESTRYFFFRGVVDHGFGYVEELPEPTVVEVQCAEMIRVFGADWYDGIENFDGEWAGPIPVPATMKETKRGR